MSEICEWKAELVDDTLKEVLIAAAEYCSNNKASGLARIKAQKDIRIYDIARQGYKDKKEQKQAIEPLKKDLDNIYNLMINNVNCNSIQNEAYKIDKKYAIANYYRFHKCLKVD